MKDTLSLLVYSATVGTLAVSVRSESETWLPSTKYTSRKVGQMTKIGKQ